MIVYIVMYRDQFGGELICRTIAATEGGIVASRGFRVAKTRPVSDRDLRDRALHEEINRIHAENYGVYGARKIWHAMRREGWVIGRDHCARLMRKAGMHGVIRGRKPRTTQPSPLRDERPDLMESSFQAPAPNRRWVADITYVRTTSGFCDTAFVIDAFFRRIAGWATMRTEDLQLDALEHALIAAKDQAIGGLMHHSDCGSQYVSIRYTEHLAEAGITASVGSRGDSYDNALAETVNGLYKAELIKARPA